MKKFILAFTMISALTRCHLIPTDSATAISITKTKDEYKFEFSNCRNKAQKGGMHALDVYRRTSKDTKELICTIKIDRTPPISPMIGEWIYGSLVNGYNVEGCEPLKNGETYTLAANGAGLPGYLEFTIDEFGTPKIIRDVCSDTK